MKGWAIDIGTTNTGIACWDVQPLLALLDSRRLDAVGRQCVRDAVASIQSRLVGAEVGQLSLAARGPESGRLSLAKPVAGSGDLSLAQED